MNNSEDLLKEEVYKALEKASQKHTLILGQSQLVDTTLTKMRNVLQKSKYLLPISRLIKTSFQAA